MKKLVKAISFTLILASLTVKIIAVDMYSTQALPSENKIITGLTVNQVLKNSVITHSSNGGLEGYYKSTHDAAPGFQYTIEFDWVAKTNASGDYIFNNISNANSKMETTSFAELYLINPSFKEIKDQYYFSSNRKYVTFDVEYSMTYGFRTEPIQTYYHSNSHEIWMENIS